MSIQKSKEVVHGPNFWSLTCGGNGNKKKSEDKINKVMGDW